MKKKIKVACVVAQFHKEIANAMVVEAEKTLKEHNGAVYSIVRVSGCFELPLAVKRRIKKDSIDAIVVLGYIEKGETLHGEVMGHAVHHALMQLQLEYGKPIGFGIIGPGATEKQARARMKGASRAAVLAALSQL